MNCQNKNLNRSMALISSIFIMAFFVFVNYTNASTGTLSIGEDEDGVTGACTGRHWYQSFTPTSDWAITQFDLKARMLSIANDGIITYQICEDSTCASSLYTEIVIFSATSSDFAWEEHEIPIGYNPILASGTTYYLHVEGESTCPNTSWSCKVDYANPYSGGRAWSSVNDDQFVKIYYDTDIASYQPPPPIMTGLRTGSI